MRGRPAIGVGGTNRFRHAYDDFVKFQVGEPTVLYVHDAGCLRPYRRHSAPSVGCPLEGFGHPTLGTHPPAALWASARNWVPPCTNSRQAVVCAAGRVPPASPPLARASCPLVPPLASRVDPLSRKWPSSLRSGGIDPRYPQRQKRRATSVRWPFSVLPDQCAWPWWPWPSSCFSTGFSTTAVSVVSTIRATDAALRTAERVTLTGSMMPSATRSP